jgi:prepilin-type N-terminal cleavage/methylation domain-containing protein
MNMTSFPRQRGFSLVELMISVTISLVILGGLAAMLINVSRSNNEMAKSNSQIENGRYAVQVLENDLVHAGFWGEYVPQFDDLSWLFRASDAPTGVPDPCRAYAADDFDSATTTDWDFTYINNLLGIGVQPSEDAPGGCVLANKKASTDVLVVRHAATCIAGEPNCDDEVAGKLYFQSGLCTTGTWGTATGGGNNTVVLQPPSSTSNTSAIVDGYKGMRIRLLTGPGAGDTRVNSAYDPSTYTATVTGNWSTNPVAGTTYTIVDEVLSTNAFPLMKRSCQAAQPAVKRKFESNIYYVRDYSATAGDGIPTLVRSSFDPAGPAALSHQAAQPLVEGIERFAVELGIDNVRKRCLPHAAVDTATIVRINPATCVTHLTNDTLNTLARNRGDGNADLFVRCTTAVPCTADQLRNAVSTKIHLLVRNSEPTLGYTDSKTYCLATLPADGVCPAASVAGPFNDGFKRHLFSTSIRLTTISGRRETP